MRTIERLISRFFGYPLLTFQIVLYVAIAWGIFGSELGMPDLFWNEFWWSQVAVGASVCWLFGTVVFVNMLLVGPRDLPGRPTDAGPKFQNRGQWSLFPSRNPGVRLAGRRVFGWLMLLLIVIYGGKWIALYASAFREAKTGMGADAKLSFFFDFLRPVLYHKSLLAAWEVFRSQWFGVWFVAGYLGSFFLGGLISYLAHHTGLREWLADRDWLRRSFNNPAIAIPTVPVPAGRGDIPLNAIPATEVPFISDGFRFPDDDPTDRRVQIAAYNLRTLLLLHAMAAVFAGVIVVFTLIVLIPPMFGVQLFSPVVIFSLFLILMNIGGGLIAFRVRAPRLLAAIFLTYLIVLNLSSVAPYRMTYDNIAGINPKDNQPINYDNPLPLDDKTYLESYRTQSPEGGLISGDELLRNFKKKWQDPQNTGKPIRDTKPRLVVVAVSGGGIRAAVWTGVVMEGLEHRFDGTNGRVKIRDNIRLFAGASGGMVGAGAYAADFDHGPLQTNYNDRDKYTRRTGLYPFSNALAEDSLSPVIQTMVVRDFTVNTMLPLRFKTDRGRTLEATWDENFKRMGKGDDPNRVAGRWGETSPYQKKFRDLATAERTCDRPSLIFAPMMVEDGKRLLISNLDLDALTRPKTHRLNASQTTSSEEIDLPAIEFFRLFPASKDFTVGSAARMSATFPVVSPAVALPVTPTRRVVDAGYFDNYGINVITHWLLDHQKAVVDNTSGVLLIQIRAYPLEKSGLEFMDETPSPALAIVGAVSAPLEALLNARGMGAYHRNNELVAELQRVFNTDPRVKQSSNPAARGDFFTTVIFEQEQDAALSWHLTQPQKMEVAKGFYSGPTNPAEPHAEWELRRDIEQKLIHIENWFAKP